MMVLQLQDATCGYGNRAVLSDISLTLNSGEIVCLLGPNGAGKTTMFRSILGFLRLIKGEVTLDGIPRSQISSRKFSMRVGYVPQSHEPPFAFSVLDIVVMGRTAHMKALSGPDKSDYLIANSALEQLGIGYLRDRPYTEISGGERQMVLIARALTQQPELLVMDEPTANLDYGNQVRVLGCIKSLAESGLGVLMTTHSPDHAFLCCTRVILITKDKQVLSGTVDEIITEENLKAAYGVDVRITQTLDNKGKPIKTCVPLLDDL